MNPLPTVLVTKVLASTPKPIERPKIKSPDWRNQEVVRSAGDKEDRFRYADWRNW